VRRLEKAAVLEKIKSDKLIPVIRTSTTDDARATVETLAENSISVFELTLTIPNSSDLIRALAKQYTNFLLGAGTVLTVEEAQNCVEAGAKFVVSPVYNPKIIEYCRIKEVVVVSAGLTPTEIYQAWEAGADMVKVFPCNAMGGAVYIKALKTVFPKVELMPTGGVTLETIKNFLQAGATAVGVGADLLDLQLLKQERKALIAEKINRYLEKVSEFKNSIG
jgi:2-dehydro-3-deoxyphosphogluconate aldolase / (4S)-4-hydroxy-2-oxoglutarate aldolase